jgi:adenylyltransferase/sulfurtransferase
MQKLDLAESRYHRQELITWWDQAKLRASRVLVVGAGAIGNEVVKNLALVGVGSVTIVDMDKIEHSNLARCVFFRENHEGSYKAQVLASEAKLLNPEIETFSFNVPVQRLGIGYLRNFDIVIGALDNREARAWVNQATRKLGMYWIDAAIEGLRGLVRTFGPTGACYACTLTENDYKQMSHRRSCALLAPEEIISGKTPTNATTAGVVAGVQVQEAIKFLVGRTDLLSLVGKCWVYTGDSMTTYVTGYQEDEFCLAHDVYDEVLEGEDARTLIDFVNFAKANAPDEPHAIDFEEDLIQIRSCPKCHDGQPIQIAKLRSSLAVGEGRCESCGHELAGQIQTSISVDEELASAPIGSFGFAISDIVTIRSANNRQHFIVKG